MNNPTSITLHWIGPTPGQTPDVVRNYWLKGNDGKGIEASAHYVIKDSLCLQCIPEQEVAWHCGSKGNYSSIGIEVIPMSIEGEYSADSIDTIIQLLKHLPRVQLLRHYDWTQKDCPKFYTPLVKDGQKRWDELLEELYRERDEI